MQILLHSDPNTDGSHLMAAHLDAVVKDALGRFGERITRVEAHLSNVISDAKPGVADIHCTLMAKLLRLEPVVVKDQAGNAHQAIDGALRKLIRAVATAIEKHDPHHQRSAAGSSSGDDDGEPGETP
jgi:ribosome-associated translation inhibitor RaiA